jgi:Fe2+ transport system protein FeoA
MYLSNNFKNKNVKVLSVNFEDTNVLHKIYNIGIRPNAIIKVLDYDSNPKLIHLLICGVEYILRSKDARFINVKEHK